MKKLNKEQQVARLLQSINTLFGLVAFAPAFLCWGCATIFLSTNDKDFEAFLYSSILLIIFYGYTIISPRIYINEYYNKHVSLGYWLIVLITNLITIVFFLTNDFAKIVFVPAIPLIISFIGLIAHCGVNYTINNSNEINHED
jgi:hypothetical protein